MQNASRPQAQELGQCGTEQLEEYLDMQLFPQTVSVTNLAMKLQNDDL